MAARELDDTDTKLIALLKRDARKPVVALAKAVGLSRSAVQGRLARLEQTGTIQRYTVVLGSTGGPKGSVKAVLLLTIGSRPCAAVIQRFRDWPEIRACWSVAGPTVDAVVIAETANNEELGRVRARLAEIPGVTAITTAPVLTTVLENF